MIDIESDVFKKISTALRDEYTNMFVTGEYVKAPSSFPAVSIVEADNYMNVQTQSSEELENHVVLMYEVNAYSNKKTGKKSECKDIISIIDDEFLAMGFTRTMLANIQNYEDSTIYRMTARYRAVVSKENVIYRR